MDNYDEFEECHNDSMKEAEELIAKMDSLTKDCVYRLLWKEHVKEDVQSEMAQNEEARSLSDEDYDHIADAAAERYVFDGDYDCNRSYWANIDSLIDEQLEQYKGEIERE